MGQRHQTFIIVGNEDEDKSFNVLPYHNQWLYGKSALYNASKVLSLSDSIKHSNNSYFNKTPLDFKVDFWKHEQNVTHNYEAIRGNFGLLGFSYIGDPEPTDRVDFGDNNDGITIIDTINLTYCFMAIEAREALKYKPLFTPLSAEEYLTAYYPKNEWGDDNEALINSFNDYSIMEIKELSLFFPDQEEFKLDQVDANYKPEMTIVSDREEGEEEEEDEDEVKQTYPLASAKKTTSLLKKYFKDNYDLKVSIKSDSYSMGSSLNVTYDLGVDSSEVSKIVDQLQYGSFDGMNDLYSNEDKDPLIIDGYQLNSYKYTGASQAISDEFNFRLAKMMSDSRSYSGVFKLETIDQMNSHFDERFGSAWTWNDMLYQNFSTRHFATQDESKIKLLSCHCDQDIYFLYEVDGVQFDTRIKPEIQAKIEDEIEVVEVVSGEVQIIQYSEKAIAVIGDTKPIKDKLKELGGRFNFRLSCGAGWVFPKSKLEQIETALA